MEEIKTTKVKASIDLFPCEHYKDTIRADLLNPTIVSVTVVAKSRWAEIEIDGKKYITDRAILKGIL